MTTEQNKTTARRVIEESFNKHDLTLLDQVFAKDAINHDPSQPNLARGPQGVRETMQVYATAFPDSKVTIELEIADGDYVVQHVRTIGTHTAPLFNIPATGKKTNVTGVLTTRFQGGKVVETWSLWDQLGLMQQLGVVPMPEADAVESELTTAR